MTPMLFNLNHDLESQQLLYLQDAPDGTLLQVLENPQFRWLSLDNVVHTVMCRHTPWRPVLPYINGMLLALYFVPQATRALELGLGGGAIQRYFHHTSTIKLTSVELRHTVIDCCQRFFNPDNVVMDIIEQDAMAYLQASQLQDILFVDLFSQQACPDFLFSGGFYQRCQRALNDTGTLAINLVSNSELPVLLVSRLIAESFGQPPLLVRIPGYQNRVLLASQRQLSWPSIDPLLDFAQRHHLQLGACQLDL